MDLITAEDIFVARKLNTTEECRYNGVVCFGEEIKWTKATKLKNCPGFNSWRG
jgi:hypothetical protein